MGSTSVAYYSRSWIEFPFLISAVYIYVPLGVLVVFESIKLERTTEDGPEHHSLESRL